MQSVSLLQYLLMFPLPLLLCTSPLCCHASPMSLLLFSRALFLSQLLCLSLSSHRYSLCPERFLSFLCPAAFPFHMPFSMHHFLCIGAVLLIQRTDFSVVKFADNVLAWDVLYCFLLEHYEVC